MTASLGNLERYADLPLEVEAELGRTALSLRQILELDRNSIVELSHPANQRVDVRIGGAPVARGSIVINGDAIAVRIAELREEA